MLASNAFIESRALGFCFMFQSASMLLWFLSKLVYGRLEDLYCKAEDAIGVAKFWKRI